MIRKNGKNFKNLTDCHNHRSDSFKNLLRFQLVDNFVSNRLILLSNNQKLSILIVLNIPIAARRVANLSPLIQLPT
jgi:hypothetical protein